MPHRVTRECLTKVEKSNEQVDCDRTRGIAVDHQLPRIITFREDNLNIGMCPDPFLLPGAKGLVPRLVVTYRSVSFPIHLFTAGIVPYAGK